MEVELEVEVVEMYIELQLGALGSQVVIPVYAAERGQCSLGHGGSWPNFSWNLQNLISRCKSQVLKSQEVGQKCP